MIRALPGMAPTICQVMLPGGATLLAALAGLLAAGALAPVAEPDLTADYCVTEGMHLRLSTALGTPPRPAFWRHDPGRQRKLALRMEGMLDAVVSSANAAEPVPAPETPEPPAPPALPAESAAPRRAEARGPVRLELLARGRDLGEPLETDAFGPRSWVVIPPPPPPPPPAPPEPPRAPPLPFRFAGLLRDGEGRIQFYLQRGNALVTAAAGDRIDNTYLLESAEGGVLVFTYLPLQERQRLPYGVSQ